MRLAGFAVTFCVVPWLGLAATASPSDDELLAPLTTPAADQPPSAKPKPVAKPIKKKPTGRPPITAADTELALTLIPAVEGAHLFFDGRDMGVFPQPILRINPGAHVVAVRRLGYAELEKTVRAPKGRRTDLLLKIEAQSGVLYLGGSPDGARVQVDASPSGVLPLAGVLLPPGPHLLRVEADGYEAREKRVVMVAGRDERQQLDLTPVPVEPSAWASTDPLPAVTVKKSTETPFFGRWYVWVGIGVIAAGAAAGGWAIANSAQGPAPTPSQVCSGPCDAVLNGRVGGAGAF